MCLAIQRNSFSHREETEIITHDDAAFAPVSYLKFKKCRLETKSSDEMRDISDAVQIPQWETSWEKYDQVVESMNQADKTVALSQGVTLVDIADSECSGYISANRGQYYAISETTAYSDQSSGREFADIQDETRQCMTNLQNRLQGCGLGWDNVVMIQVYVSNMADFALVNQVYKSFFDINPPPRYV
jgi:diphthine-ammonia ligase